MVLAEYELENELTVEQAEELTLMAESLKSSVEWVTIECITDCYYAYETVMQIKKVLIALDIEELPNLKPNIVVAASEETEKRKFTIKFYDTKPKLVKNFFKK